MPAINHGTLQTSLRDMLKRAYIRFCIRQVNSVTIIDKREVDSKMNQKTGLKECVVKLNRNYATMRLV